MLDPYGEVRVAWADFRDAVLDNLVYPWAIPTVYRLARLVDRIKHG